MSNFLLNKNSFPGKSCGFGDLLAIFYILENLSNQIRKKIFINTIDIDTNFFYSLKFNNIYLNEKDIGDNYIDLIKAVIKNKKKCKNKKGHFNGCFFISALVYYLEKEYKFDNTISNPIDCSIIKNKKFNTYAQLDHRSAHPSRTLSSAKIKNIFFKNNCIILGGEDTKRYIDGDNVIYELGDIDFIIKKLLDCKLFIGVDSGISHLAGCLGINSKIYVRDFCGCLTKYYRSYKNCKVINLEKNL